jgi:hypothetical protein
MVNEVDLVFRARELIGKQGFFLLLYDVIDSRKFSNKYGYKKLYGELGKFHKEVNRRFKDAIITHEIGLGTNLSRFRTIVGDGGGAYFSDIVVILPIIKLAEELPFKLRWNVAKDGWDKKNTKIIR